MKEIKNSSFRRVDLLIKLGGEEGISGRSISGEAGLPRETLKELPAHLAQHLKNGGTVIIDILGNIFTV